MDELPIMTNREVFGELVRCAARVAGLLAHRRLHWSRDRVGSRVSLPDGRSFVVFRETSCDEDGDGPVVTVAVWFHLRGVPAGARLRRFAFERESILNTVLYAGARGYRTKLWLVDPVSSDYAGLYEWRGVEAGRAYARYITAVLRPLSRPGSVGAVVLEHSSLAEYLLRS